MNDETTVATPAPAPASLTIRDRLRSPAILAELAAVLPKHCTPERMARVALTALTRTPELAECDQASFFECLLSLSQWGLEPDDRQAWLVPFENRKRGVIECKLMIGYKGYVDLAFRTSVVKRIHSDVVREGDLFDYNLGEVERHVPWFLRRDALRPAEPGHVYAAYSHIELIRDASKGEVMSFEEIESRRRRSRNADKGPWATDWCEMAKKTVFRRATKWLPLSVEMISAVERDDELEQEEDDDGVVEAFRKGGAR